MKLINSKYTFARNHAHHETEIWFPASNVTLRLKSTENRTGPDVDNGQAVQEILVHSLHELIHFQRHGILGRPEVEMDIGLGGQVDKLT